MNLYIYLYRIRKTLLFFFFLSVPRDKYAHDDCRSSINVTKCIIVGRTYNVTDEYDGIEINNSPGWNFENHDGKRMKKNLLPALFRGWPPL